MESRFTENRTSTDLPVDFLKMVAQVYSTHFTEGLKTFEAHKTKPYFKAFGKIYSNEIVLSVSLLSEGHISATTVHASVDFDPKASAPKAEDLLNHQVDAIGSVFALLFETPETIEQLASDSLSAFEEVPFQWSPMDIEKRTVFVKVDKSNPLIEAMTDDWLEQHDPERKMARAVQEKEAEGLFVVSPAAKKKKEDLH